MTPAGEGTGPGVPDDVSERVTGLLDRYGRSYAADAGIRLADTPAPLYQLLVLATLLSARITAPIAVAAARELFAAGMRTPRGMREATWQQRVDALGHGHYRRYDERTATMLGDGARLCHDRWGDDLRRMRADAGGDVDRLRASLTGFPGVGPVGASIFLREVQGVWPDVAPFVDDRMRAGARAAGLPDDPATITGLVPRNELPRLAAALVKAERSAVKAERSARERV